MLRSHSLRVIMAVALAVLVLACTSFAFGGCINIGSSGSRRANGEEASDGSAKSEEAVRLILGKVGAEVAGAPAEKAQVKEDAKDDAKADVEVEVTPPEIDPPEPEDQE